MTWISIKDWLPQQQVYVLIYDGYGEYHVAFWENKKHSANSEDTYVHWSTRHGEVVWPTAWTLLPEYFNTD